MELKIVDTPKELREKFGNKCIMGIDEKGQVFYTEGKVVILEVK